MKMIRHLIQWFFCATLIVTPVAMAQDVDIEPEGESVTESLLPRVDETDVGYLTRLLQEGLSERGREVRISGFSGALRSRATFEQLSIEDDEGVWLLVEGAALQWNRSALFQRRIEIGEISAERVTILRAPVGNDTEAELFSMPEFELPELPLSVQLDQLQIDEVILGEALFGQELRATVSGAASLADGEGNAQLRVDRIDEVAGQFRLEGAFSNETRILSLNLAIEEDAGGLAVTMLDIPERPSAALTVVGEGPIEDFTADITLATDGEPRVEGQFQLQTAQPGVAQAVTLDLAGDLRPFLQDEFHPFFGADSRLNTRARRFDDGSLSLDDLDVRTDKLALRGRMRLGPDNLPELIDLRGEVRSRDGSRVVLPIGAGETSIESAELRLAFDASVNEDWELVLDLLGYDDSNFKVESLFINGLGRITADGFGEDIDVVDALIDFTALGLAATDPGLNEALGPSVSGSLAVIWREDRPLLLPGFQLEGRDYALNGRARLDDGVIFANTIAEFRDVSRLSTLAGRPLSGGVQAEVDATIGPERDRFLVSAEITGQNLTVDQPELDRLLAGSSQITVDAHGADGQIILRQLEATARTLRADLRGQLSAEEIDLRGEIDFSDLSVLGDAYGGALDAELAVRGPIEREMLTLEAVAHDLTVGQEDANRLLRGETRLALEGQRDGAAFDLESLRVSNDAITLDAEGRYEAGASRLDVRSTVPDLGAVRPNLGGRIVAEASLREVGDERRVTAEATATNLRLGAATADNLLAGTHRLNASLVQRPDEVLLETLTLTGPQLNANVTGRIADGRPALQLDARLNNLAAVVPGIAGPVSLSGTARGTDRGYALDIGLSGPGDLTAQIAGDISTELQANLAIRGGTDLALINPRLEPRSILGPAEFNLTMNGPLALSSLSGTAQARNVTLVLPRQRLRLADISAQAQISGGLTSVSLAGRAADGGQIALSGDINLAAPITGDLTARLDAFRFIDPRLFETDISGEVRITGELTQGPLLSGNLQLDRTELRIPRVGLVGRGYVPPNIRHVGETGAARQTRNRAGIFAGQTHGREPRPASLDINIDAPSRIFLRGRGLDAELGGSLRLTGTTADVIPIGQFSLIRGRLNLLGNRFDLNEGFASLQGKFVPFIRLVASTERAGVNVRVVLEARADAPEVRFESIPPLPEEEIVSLLLFGRGLDTLSAFQAAQLASSVAILSGQTEGIMERLRRNIGVDDLDVRTDEDGETFIRLGTYLTEQIYTDVEVSPEGSAEVSINIDLSPSVTARGRIDNEGRAGVGLFFERDY